MSKYKIARLLSPILNVGLLLIIRWAFSMEVAILVGIGTIVATIDEFGYKWEEKQDGK